ncbi:MAG: choice-of-anchor tandem repeat NxxGxxAF-containing protein [Pirellulales bacterium]
MASRSLDRHDRISYSRLEMYSMCRAVCLMAALGALVSARGLGAEYAIGPIVLIGDHLPGMDENLAVGAGGGAFSGAYPAIFTPDGEVLSPVSIADPTDPNEHIGYDVWRFPAASNPVHIPLPTTDWGVAARAVNSETTYVQTEYPVGGWRRERIFAVEGGTVTEIANTVDPPPGATGTIYYFSHILANENVLAFGGYLLPITAPARLGVWARHNGVVSPVAITGQPAPGFPNDAPYDEVILGGVSHLGDVLFSADVTYSGNRNRDWAIYRNDGVSTQPLLVGGQATPGLDLTFGASSILASNNVGNFVFASRLVGANAAFTNDETIWSYDNSDMRMIARESLPALGTDSGTQFRDFYEVSVNDAGMIAFRAETYHPTFGVRSTIFLTDGSDEPAAVLEVGDLIEGSRVTRINEPRLAANGDFAVDIRLADGNSTAPGIALYSHAAKSLELVRAGDSLLLSPGDERIIDDIRLSGSDVMGQRLPGPDGSVLFYAWFTDSTGGLFVATPTFLPGDLDFNDVVDARDVALFASNFGRHNAAIPAAADLNSDESVDLRDLALLQSYLSLSDSSAAAVPEPPATILFLLGVATLVGCSRRRETAAAY